MDAAQIAQVLTATLNPDTTTRVSAELKLAELFATPATGLALSQLVLTQDADISLRQSACISLRKYIKERWSPFFQSFKGSAPPPELKDQIRQVLFHGLSDPNRKIRSLCAHALSSIAKCDWPDEYPDLLQNLITLISTGSPDAVHGAMQVFTEFIRSELTEDQILPVLRELLPVLLGILGSTEHSAPTRARTVSVFRQCVTALFMVKGQFKDAVTEATTSILPVWLEAFKVLLANETLQNLIGAPNWDSILVPIQIYKTLDTLQTSFPIPLAPHLPQLLSSALYQLQAVYPVFAHYYLASSESPPRTSEDESVDLPQLICPTLDFISAAMRGRKARGWFTGDNLSLLVSAVFNLTQVTDEDEETWANNANAFIAQEEDETVQYSVRVAGFDLLGVLIDKEPVGTTRTIQTVFSQIVTSSNQARDAGNSEWWRPFEAALAAVGSQSESIVDVIDDEVDSGREKPIDLDYLLVNVVPFILTSSEQPFLQGRGFVFASQFAKLLPAHAATQYLDAAVQVIESAEAGVPVKVSAVKAVHNFCQSGDDSVLVPYAPRIAKDLGPFLGVTSEDTLSLVLETLSVVLEIDSGKWLTPELASALVVVSLEVWHKNNRDPLFISMLTDILKALASASSAGLYETVVKQALPVLVDTLGGGTKSGSATPATGGGAAGEAWVAGSAIDLISSLIEGSPESGLGDGFFALLAPNLFRCLDSAEDRDVLQNGVTCLTLVVRKDVNQLLSWSDAAGRSGLDHTLGLVAKLLQNQDESGGLAIGDLIIHLFRKTGEAVLPVLPQLLQAMLTSMLTAKTATFTQSLVVPFAFLINNQRDTVLDLIEPLVINDRSGLDILIQTWCENAETFQGYWPTRVSTLGLVQLFLSERPSLRNLSVKGDMILRPETKNVIMTRSRTKNTPHEFTRIAFPVKALKIIVHDLLSGGEAATFSAGGPHGAYEVESDDGDDDWTEEEKQNQGFSKDEFSFLSDMLGPKGMAFDNDDVFDNDADDEDLKSDPVSQMDMQSHLRGFIKDFAAQDPNMFSLLLDQLSEEEILVVRGVLEAA
ncbi:ARM repeat-containing protein [Coprinopsis marcescibilis]|uniref:ARM repeat-containing protein n=1 Tax=Coprinopsis marcescibilis TaxID=230819 RepID=A0A5C3L1D6_COPMA|nr:ARM repeat-containing protein [Coprinopsis marcescibilis]